jgi:hypothetical protein
MALQLQCEQPTTLVWTPPDGAGEPSAFDIMWSHLEPVFDRDGLTGIGMEEAVLRTRTYLVRMQALPYARGANLIDTPAIPVTPTYTLVDNGSALSGSGFSWALDTLGRTTSATGEYVMSVVSGRIRHAQGTLHSTFERTSLRTGFSLSAGRYVAVDIAVSNIVVTIVEADNGGSPLVATQDLGGGLIRYFFDASWWGTSITTFLRVTVKGSVPATGSASYFEIDQVQLADSLPFIGTARQRPMSLVPGGSVRTNGSIHVTHATASLGKTIVYTHPSSTGYLPPLSPWRFSSGTVTTDSTLLSGSKITLNVPCDYRVPVSALPRGRVELWAWLYDNTTETRRVYWAVDSWMNGVQVSPTDPLRYIDLPLSPTWTLVCLAAATMPNTDIGPAGYVRVSIDTGATNVQVDEAYLFATDEGSLTVVDCGTGTASAGGPSKHLWIDAPTPDVPMGAVYRGHSSDRSDAFHAGSSTYATTWGLHEFDPRGASVFVATQGTTDAATSLQHYRRYNTFVTRED